MSEDKKLNEVIRVQRKPSSFVMMDKGFLENPELSWKAKGILAYLLSKPDNWKVIVRDLINHATDGRDSTKAGLRELKQNGHYSKTPVRDELGRISHWEGTISEVPMESLEITASSPQTDYPSTVKPLTDNPSMENPSRNNNDLSNNYKTLSNNQSSQVLSVPGNSKNGQDKDQTDNIEAYTALIKNNISYNDLAISRPHDLKLIDEFIAIIIDVVLSEGKFVRIGGEDKPRALVTKQLLRLNYDDIEHALDQFKGVTERITKKKQYILTLLYNCKMELDLHYTNAVISDSWK